MRDYGCPLRTDPQILEDMELFPTINFSDIRATAWKHFDRPNSMSVCNYVIKDNKVLESTSAVQTNF